MPDILSSLPNLWRGETIAELPFPQNSFVIYSESESDDRANITFWRNYCKQADRGSYAVVKSSVIGPHSTFTLKYFESEVEIDAFDLRTLLDIVPRNANLVIDISGVDHVFWAGCLIEFKGRVRSLYFIYTEPQSYRIAVPTSDTEDLETSLFDLSHRSRGVSPLPKFTNLHSPELFDGRAVFIPLLGFEGHRALNVLSGLDPAPIDVIPIIAVPGYRLEFPSFTATCNGSFFEDTGSVARTRYAPANDPFRTCEVLHSIGQDFRDHYMYIAPVGTRPHALGALLFADKERDRTEILFDHPIRKEKSRQGIGSAHLYRIF